MDEWGEKRTKEMRGLPDELTGVFVGVEEFEPDHCLGSDVWSEKMMRRIEHLGKTKTENKKPQPKKTDKQANKQSWQKQAEGDQKGKKRNQEKITFFITISAFFITISASR